MQFTASSERYAQCIAVSKRTRWDIDRDVIRGRKLDVSKKFLPDGLSNVGSLLFLDDAEGRLLSQIQGRTYANMLGLVERYIGVKMLEVSHDHHLGDQIALEALIRFTDDELKHQTLFRRVEAMAADGMPEGYAFLPQPNDVASAVLSKSTWAVLALTCHIELFTHEHYRLSIEPDAGLSDLWKDVFRFHWKEESQHVVLDELEWEREDAKLTPAQRDVAVGEFIELISAMDAMLQTQARADADYFLHVCGRRLREAQAQHLRATVLHAYRWQYIGSGINGVRFRRILRRMITEAQLQRTDTALQLIFD